MPIISQDTALEATRADLLREITRGSTVDNLKHAGQILQGGPALGYEVWARWMEANPRKVRPVNYVILFAEAVVAGIATEKVEKRFPDAKGLAQYLIDHMNSQHGAIMHRLPFIFDSSATSSPNRTNAGLPTSPKSIADVDSHLPKPEGSR